MIEIAAHYCPVHIDRSRFAADSFGACGVNSRTVAGDFGEPIALIQPVKIVIVNNRDLTLCQLDRFQLSLPLFCQAGNTALNVFEDSHDHFVVLDFLIQVIIQNLTNHQKGFVSAC